MDPTVYVAFIALLATMATVTGGVIVAVMTNRRDAQTKADTDSRLQKSDREAALEERIALRDEQIVDLKEALRRCLVNADPRDLVGRDR